MNIFIQSGIDYYLGIRVAHCWARLGLPIPYSLLTSIFNLTVPRGRWAHSAPQMLVPTVVEVFQRYDVICIKYITVKLNCCFQIFISSQADEGLF